MWIRGAVYDDADDLVVDSQRFAVTGSPWAAADPIRYTGRPRHRLRRLEGRWLYGGHWVQHFGHFMIETVPTLWPTGPQLGDVVGLVFHKYMFRRWSLEPWMQRVLDLAGHAGRPIEVVGQLNGMAVEELVVPSRPVVMRGWAQAAAVEVWDRIATHREPSATRPPDSLTYLSRTKVNAHARADGRLVRTSAARDRALDQVFARCGFDVVHPEELPIDDQLEVFARASVLAGLTGSALHMAAYAASTAHVIEVGDRRNPRAGHPTQIAIDAARQRRRAFLPHGLARGDLRSAVRRLVAALHA